jgi:hypothetical protein
VAASKEQLRKLREKYGLGEYGKGKKGAIKRRRKITPKDKRTLKKEFLKEFPDAF